MEPGERFSLLLKLCLPFLVLVALRAYPRPYRVVDGLDQSRLFQQAGQSEDAANALRQVVEREPWRAYLWEQIGTAELAANRFLEAIEAFNQAAATGQLSLEGNFKLAEAYRLAGDPDAAEDAWQALLDRAGPSGLELKRRVFEQMLRLQHEQGDFPAAVDILRAWQVAEPQNPSVAFRLGLYLAVVDPDQAIPFLVAASQADSVYTPAMTKIRRGINLASESGEPGYGWVMIGRALSSAGEWELAGEAFRLATRAAPQYAEAWALLAEARYQMGSGDRQALARAAALDPESVVVRALVALDYRRQGKPDLALIYLEKIAGQEPEEPIWQVELANVQCEIGDLQAALQHYQRAIELAPTISLYWQYLARFSIEYGVSVQDVGLPAARQAVLLAPNDPAALDVMGWTMASLSDFASAERFLHQAVERDATYAPAQLHLGQLYLQQGNLDRAYAYLKRAAELSGQAQVGEIARRLLRQYYGDDG